MKILNLDETTKGILEKIEEVDALVKDGHFVLSTGRHSTAFLKINMLIQNVGLIEKICEVISNNFKEDGVNVVLSSPYMPGPIFAYGVARAPSYKERNPRIVIPIVERQTLKVSPRNIIRPNEKVLIVHDIVVRGHLLNQLEDLVTQSKADIAGIGLVFDVSLSTDFMLPESVKSFVLFKADFGNQDAISCSICKENKIELQNLYT